MIKLLVADEQPLFCEGVRCVAAKAKDISVTASASSEVELSTLLEKSACDVLVLGLAGTGKHSLDLIANFEQRFPNLKVLVMEMAISDSYIVRILRSRASGFLCKSAKPEEFIHAVRQVHETGRYLNPEIAEKIAFRLGRERDQEPHETLSDREYEVLRMIGAGMTIRTIARDLEISQNTVNTHRYRILQKMGMKSSAELIHYAVKHRLVE